MSELLSESYISQVIRDARRYQGQWTGSAGSQAAHAMRLIREREVLMSIIAEREQDGDVRAQAQLVEQAFAGYRERCQRVASSSEAPICRKVYGAESPAEKLLETAQETVRQRRSTYGPPAEHFARTVAAVNAIFANKLREPLTVADWAQVMILDKLARHQGSGKSVDTPVDLAGYAACLAEVESA